MKMILVSSFCSQKTFERCFCKNPGGVGIAPQKFFSALISGCSESGVTIRCVTEAPYGKISRYHRFKNDSESQIQFTYVPEFNLGSISLFGRILLLSLWVNFDVVRYGRPDAVFCDAASLWQTLAALVTGRLWNIPVIGAVTDLQYLNPELQCSRKGKILSSLMERALKSFDGFLLVAPKMQQILEVGEKPTLLVEGVVMTRGATSAFTVKTPEVPVRRVLLYAGYLHETNGIQMLLNAFISANFSDVDLVLYGPGPLVDLVQRLAAIHSNIRYGGVVSSAEMTEIQKAATVLINPRPNSAWFAPYSFPSKQLEYMLSGVPTLTMRLPSMPNEYFEYVYLIEDETIDAVRDALIRVFSIPGKELAMTGEKARHFVLHQKNHRVQGGRLANFLRYYFGNFASI